MGRQIGRSDVDKGGGDSDLSGRVTGDGVGGASDVGSQAKAADCAGCQGNTARRYRPSPLAQDKLSQSCAGGY